MINARITVDGYVFEKRGDRYVNDATGLRIEITQTKRPFSAHIIGRAGRTLHMKAGNGRRITFGDLETCIETALKWIKSNG